MSTHESLNIPPQPKKDEKKKQHSNLEQTSIYMPVTAKKYAVTKAGITLLSEYVNGQKMAIID